MGREDEAIHDWFITSARPSEAEIHAVLTELDREPLTLAKLVERLNLTKTDIEKVLKTLSVAELSPIIKIGTTYQRTPVPYSYNEVHEAALKQRRVEERERFVGYSKTTDCLMKVVAQELDDYNAVQCGKCANCIDQEIVSGKILDTTLIRAMAFLKRSEFPIKPRKQWTSMAFPIYDFTGRIAEHLRCEVGICLSNYGDPGIATCVKNDKVEGHFRDELVLAAVEALQTSTTIPKPEWVCAVPSLRSGNLVPDFAIRLANALSVEYVQAIEKVQATEPQKAQKNSFRQAHNLDGAFQVREIRPGVALLVDDMVDSGWTFTVIGALLRTTGSDPVVPLALSSTGHGSDDE